MSQVTFTKYTFVELILCYNAHEVNVSKVNFTAPEAATEQPADIEAEPDFVRPHRGARALPVGENGIRFG